MTDISTETSIKDAYVDPEERVLEPDSIDPTLLDRMPQPTGWRLLVLPLLCRYRQVSEWSLV